MRHQATQPPPADAAERYRRAGYWHAARSRAAHLAAVAAGGSRIALVDDGSQWTFDELADAIEHVGDELVQAGVTPDDAVLLVAPLRNSAAAAYLGAVFHGAVAVMLDRRCGEADVVSAVRTANPRVALAFDDDALRLDLARHCDVLSLDRIDTRHRPKQSPDATDLDPDVPAVVVFTSGTTDAPKGVVHTINSLRCGVANMITALNIGADDALFLSTPLASITGLLQLESALTKHAKLILEEKFSAQRSLQRVYDHGATVIGGAPFIAETILDEALRVDQPIPLRCIAVGGSMVPPTVLEKAAAFGIVAVRVYGSSEAPFSTATCSTDRPATSDDGVPMPGVEVSLQAPDDELLIRGPHQFHGYLESTQNDGAFSGDWVRTGDQAEVEHQRVRIKGRLKEVVIRKGMKISLSEIDSAASSLGECAAFSRPDKTTGEHLALAVRSAGDDVSYATVVANLTSTGLAKWKLPEEIVIWRGPLPRTASGKVNRRELADESRNHRSLFAPRLRG